MIYLGATKSWFTAALIKREKIVLDECFYSLDRPKKPLQRILVREKKVMFDEFSV